MASHLRSLERFHSELPAKGERKVREGERCNFVERELRDEQGGGRGGGFCLDIIICIVNATRETMMREGEKAASRFEGSHAKMRTKLP